ncbi:MAG: hypothetical protein JNK11_03225 [Alphaproteobacteria bacterium]|nr:hypothetical protein [Alphaproteobacteria bacterium]
MLIRRLLAAGMLVLLAATRGAGAAGTGAPGAEGRDVELLGAALQVGSVLAGIRIATECPWFPADKRELLAGRLERGKQEFLGSLLSYGYARHEIDRARELIDGSAAEMLMRLSGGRLVLCNRRDFRRTVTDSLAELEGSPDDRLAALAKALPDLGIAMPDAKTVTMLPLPAPLPAAPVRKPAAAADLAPPRPAARATQQEAPLLAVSVAATPASPPTGPPPGPPKAFDSVDFDRILLMEGIHARCGALKSDEAGRVRKVLQAAAPRFVTGRRGIDDYLAIRRADGLRAAKLVRCASRESSQAVREGRAAVARFR